MNICIYTSGEPSLANRLNIGRLIADRPGHNYSFLNVKSQPAPKRGLAQALKGRYAAMRFDDGRFDYARDLETIREKLEPGIQPVDKKQFRNGEADAVNDEKSIKYLEEVKPDIIIQAGAGILKPCTFGLAARGTINVHHGIAPEIRGIDSTFWCLFYGITDKIGVSCHFIDEGLDTGAIITQSYLSPTLQSFVEIQAANYLLGKDVLLRGVDILDKGGYKVQSAGEVKSWYFGNVNPFLYYALKKRNFHPLMKITERAFKMKEKKIVAAG